MQRIVITGSSGFIGKHLVRKLAGLGQFELILPVRTMNSAEHPLPAARVFVADFRDEKAWLKLLRPDDVVIHLAGLAHKAVKAEDTAGVFYDANVAPTQALASAAQQQGIKQFIYISSIGVYGSSSQDIVTVGSPLDADSDYTRSKLEAEQVLQSIKNRSFSACILRIPLVYGADAPGNFGSLLRLVASRLPLPFAAVKSKKTFLAVDTLTEILLRLVRLHTNTDRIFIAADLHTLCFKSLLEHMAAGMGFKLINLHIPVWALRLGLSAIGFRHIYRKLCLPLEVDPSELYSVLGWLPLQHSSILIQQTARTYAKRKSES